MKNAEAIAMKNGKAAAPGTCLVRYQDVQNREGSEAQVDSLVEKSHEIVLIRFTAIGLDLRTAAP